MSTEPLEWNLDITVNGLSLEKFLERLQAMLDELRPFMERLDKLNLTEQKECV